MSLPSLPDFDALWDYDRPDRTENSFREILLQFPENEPAFLELLTQIARAQGLQRKFEQAHQTLDQVERRLNHALTRPKARYLLERGRVYNSAGDPERARPLFEEAFDVARQLREDSFAIDALHMLAIVADPEQSLSWNRRAIELAESSGQAQAQDWLGSLYNNTGWAYHDLGDYIPALQIFEKAEAWQRGRGRLPQARIASYCVARTLRSLGRVEEAFARLQMLENELEAAGESDGYVFEEIGECLRALNRPGEAQPYFAQAFRQLSQDPWLREREPERLIRLQNLSAETS